MLLYIIVGLMLVFTAHATPISELEEKVNALETKITVMQSQLEHGGKKFQTLRYATSKYS